DALTAMVQSIRGHAMPFPRDDVIEEIGKLREGLRESRKTGEGTHIKMPGFMREALEERGAMAPVAEMPEEAPVAEAPIAEGPVAQAPVAEAWATGSSAMGASATGA